MGYNPSGGEAWFGFTVACAFVVLVARLSPHLSLVELAAGAFPVGAIVSAWVVYLLSCLTSAIGPHTLYGSSLFLAYVAYEHVPEFRRRIGPALRAALLPGTALADTVLTLLLVAAAACALVPLYSTRFIPEHDGKVHSGGSCWADLPIHMHMAQSFLEGRNRDVSWGGMSSPVFAGEPMAYPFLPDFHAAVLVRWGTTLRWAMLLPGLTLALALIALFYTFTARVTGSRLGGVLAVLIAVGAGGMGGPHLALRDGFARALLADTAQNDTSGDGKIVWFAFIPHVLMPQRGANFAYPMVLFVLTLIWVAGDMRRPAAGAAAGISSAVAVFSSGAAPVAPAALSNTERRSILLMCAAFAGMLPLIQAHSFVALAVMISVSFALDCHKWLADPRLLVSWGLAGVLALAMGYPQMFLFKHQVQVGAGGHFLNAQWWYANHDIGKPAGVVGFFNFWWMNLGPALPLFLLCCGLQAWELAQAHLLARERRAAFALAAPADGGAKAWDAFYGDSVFREAPDSVLAAAAAGMAGGAGALSASAASAARGRAAVRAAPQQRASSSGAGASGSDEARGLGLGLGGHSSSQSEMNLTPAKGARGGARAPSPQGIGSPHIELQMRIQHLDIEYTLPDPASSDPNAGHRFKLALPEGASHKGGAHGAGGSGQQTVVLTNLDTQQAVTHGSQHAHAAVTHTTAQGARAEAALGTDLGSMGVAPANAVSAYAYATYRDPKHSTFFAEHLWRVVKASLRESVGLEVDAWLAPEHYSWEAPDRALFHLNALTLSGRGLDQLKLAAAAFCVFLLGNAVNFQPWDRDNTKLFYVWVFVSATFSGALLAAPFEFLVAALFGGSGGGAAAGAPAVKPKDASSVAAAAAAAAAADAAGPGGAALEALPGFLRFSALLSPLSTRAFAQVLFVAGDKGPQVQLAAQSASVPAASGRAAGLGESGGAPTLPRLRVGLPKRLYPEGADKSDATALRAAGRRGAAGAAATLGALAALPTLALLTCTGFMMIAREYGIYHVLLDQEQLQTGDWLIKNTPPKGVFLHKDVHITPAGCLAGRPTLVAYNGWMWSHGYNYYDRDRDRAYAHENALKDSDPQAYNSLRRWGVRYVLGENMPRHHRPSQQAHDEAVAKGESPPAFDADLFLDGQLKRLYQNGRFDVLEVLGYGFPPQ